MDHPDSPESPRPDPSHEDGEVVSPAPGALDPEGLAPADLTPPPEAIGDNTAILPGPGGGAGGGLPGAVAPSAATMPFQGEIDPLVGHVLRGKWRVLERLGAGSFGTVYKVRDEKGGWVEALKILGVDRLTGIDAENARARFLREAQIMKDLGKESHHIVGLSTYEEDLEAGLIYFLMELVEGDSLAELVHREGPFAPERVVRLALQVCEALMVAHEGPEQVVHRDLKLENLMLTRDRAGAEVVKVLDFGIAKIAEQEADSRLTSVGTSLGTPGYAAPEQLRAGQVDGRTDLFAFGVILYALLTGKDPWLGHPAGEPTTQIYELMVASDRAEVIPMATTGVQVPPALEEIVLRLLRRDPDERFPSARELREALQRYATAAPAAATPTASATAPPPRRTGLLVGATAGIVLVGLVGLAQPWGRTLSLGDLQDRARSGGLPAVRVTPEGLEGRVATLGFLPSPFRTPVPEGTLPEALRGLREAGVEVRAWERIRPLLEAAVRAQGELRYYGAGGEDVRGYAESILALDPENPEARSLLRKVAERMAWDAEASLDDGDPDAALAILRACVEIEAEHARCRALLPQG